MNRNLIAGLAVCAMALQASAGLVLWSGTPTDVNITGNNADILAAGTFKFQSVTGGSLDVVGAITVADGVTGNVIIHIARNPADNAGTNGATDVGEIDLTNDQTTLVGNLAELRITGDLATAGPIVVANVTGVVAVTDDVLNSFTINNDLDGDLSADVMGNITIIRDINSAGDTLTANAVGDISIGRDHVGVITVVGSCGNITITRSFTGSITAGSAGNLTSTQSSGTANGDLTINGSHAGNITIPNNVAGNYNINGSYSGTATFCSGASNSFSGLFSVDTDLTGRIEINGNLAGPGRIEVAGDATNTNAPPIKIAHSITAGTGASQQLVYVGDQLTGTITVNGALANANTGGSTHEIEVAGSLAALGAIAINYDGQSTAENDWAGSATIKVGSNEYDGTDGNNTTDRVWNVSPCVGDLSGDRSVNASDNANVAPGDSGCATPPATAPLFCVARSSASQYRTLFPGLEGSRVWHGDCNFSTGFGTDDEGAFGNLIGFASCCVTEFQDPCPGDVGESVSGTCRFDYDVDINDLATLLSGFGIASGATHCQGDLTTDGAVALDDLAQLLSHFGEVCCPLTCCPAPSTASVTISIAGFDT